MKIERKAFQPITITLETESEAEILMTIVSRIAGDMVKSPRAFGDEMYNSLLKFGLDYRDNEFNEKYKARGTIIFEDYAE